MSIPFQRICIHFFYTNMQPKKIADACNFSLSLKRPVVDREKQLTGCWLTLIISPLPHKKIFLIGWQNHACQCLPTLLVKCRPRMNSFDCDHDILQGRPSFWYPAFDILSDILNLWNQCFRPLFKNSINHDLVKCKIGL